MNRAKESGPTDPHASPHFLSSATALMHHCEVCGQEEITRRRLQVAARLSALINAAAEHDIMSCNEKDIAHPFLSADAAGGTGANLSCFRAKAGSQPLPPTLAVHHRDTTARPTVTPTATSHVFKNLGESSLRGSRWQKEQQAKPEPSVCEADSAEPLFCFYFFSPKDFYYINIF